jgi:transposase-like protein
LGVEKRLSREEIVAKLREAERLQGQGATIPQVCKKLGYAVQTIYRWRRMCGSMKEDEAIRLKTLEQENARLKRILAEQVIDISMLKDLTRGNGKTPAAYAKMCRSHLDDDNCGGGT